MNQNRKTVTFYEDEVKEVISELEYKIKHGYDVINKYDELKWIVRRFIKKYEIEDKFYAYLNEQAEGYEFSCLIDDILN